RTDQLQPDAQPRQLHVGAPRRVEKMEAWAGRDVSAAVESQFAGSISSQGERQIDGVENQAGGACCTNRESVLPRPYFSRLENQVAAAQACAAPVRLADGCGGPDAHQVLRLQARLGPARPDVPQMKWPAREQRQRQARAQNLPAAFAERTIQLDQGL